MKRADAEAALGRCAELPPSARPPLVPGRDRHAGERARVRLVGDASNGEAVHYLAEERGVAARLWPVLARRWYAVQWARERRLACPTEAREAVRVRVERASTAGLARGELETWIDEVALVEWLAREPGLAPGGGDPEARVEAIARDWLRGWGIEGEVPEPDALGFHWERHAALLVELLVSGEARRLLDGAP